MEKPALKLSRVSKHFGAVKALSGIDLEFAGGEITGLIGSNGAGKSTLLNIIYGAFGPDEGQLFVNGEELRKITPEKAHALGISIIFQHRRLMPYMTVAENIFIDRMPKKSGIIDYKRMRREASELLEMLDLDIDPGRNVADLSAEEKQLVEIVKAFSREPKILLMDEPTTALRQKEVERLFDIMRNLKAKGCAVVFISHRLKEVMDICDRVSIIRDGRNIIEGSVSDFSAESIVRHMSGIEEQSAPVHREGRVQDCESLLSVRSLNTREVRDLDFEVGRSEILGFAGLGGCGIDDIFGRIFGLNRWEGGTMELDGQELKVNSPIQAIRSGIGYVPEDRQLSGEFLELSVRDNICITSAQKRPFFSTVRRGSESASAKRFIKRLSIKTESHKTLIKNLSGGNQQKAVIAKWLDADSSLILMSEPTAGIDVHAKSEVNRFIMEIAAEGKGILYTSSYITELMEVSDRILVVYKGSVFKEFKRSEFDHNKIYLAMNGLDQSSEGALTADKE